ncbi:7-carboxy-7-deazaguanine synthase QueE [Halothiobacillus sp. DCM-1]|uniref:7-carboxy-7-deazaguanine synthase QueE n=1 Tax=Halothiobacillus sp. DCM-1 TaxID=3112558 RepID=UPI003255B3BD
MTSVAEVLPRTAGLVTLRITEIFRSLQGESDRIGWPTVFIRLTGCPLRCVYCDTAYAFTGGQRQTVPEILAAVAALKTDMICVTGGEPLAQPACADLLTALCDAGYQVSLETSGALSIESVDPRVKIVMDLKTPDSGESSKNCFANLAILKPTDEIKFVIGSRRDFDWAVEEVDAHQLDRRFMVWCSPVHGAVPPQELAQWVLDSGLRLRFQLQLHKLIWGNEQGR